MSGYLFGEVARAIGVTEPTLRVMLQRHQIDFESPAPNRGWRRFSDTDVGALAVVRHLGEWGVELGVAIAIVFSLPRNYFSRGAYYPENLFVWRRESAPGFERGLVRTADVVTARDELAIPDGSAVLWVPCREIVAAAFARLDSSS